MTLRSVAVILQDPVSAFEFGVLDEVFGTDRMDEGVPPIDFRVCAETPEVALDIRFGVTLRATHDLTGTADADLVAVPACKSPHGPSPAVVAAIRDAVDRGAWVLSLCTGALTLAAAGVLDGRSCTTHWRHTERLEALAPAALVDPDVLYAQDGKIVPSARTAAGIDACLLVLRTEFGAAVTNRVARRMVVPPHRDGGQRQFIERPVPTTQADSLGPLLEWMLDHLDESHSVADLAKRSHLSARTFARRFVAETGTTPHQWLTEQRVVRARELLESSDLGIEQVATRSGFGSAALLRHHFQQGTGVSPTAYRSQHACPA